MSGKPRKTTPWAAALVVALIVLAVVAAVFAVRSCSAPEPAQEADASSSDGSLVIELPEI